MWNFKRQMYKTLNKEMIPTIPCDEIAQSGGIGVTEYILSLDKPEGGIIIIDFDARGVPDKLEIIHNGVKKATTGMTVPNSGTYDNLYGDPTIPDTAQAQETNQFIGARKGTIPNRHATFASETGITDVTFTKQQVIWWVYTPSDYVSNPTVMVRITGIEGTEWNLQRLCTDQDPIGI